MMLGRERASVEEGRVEGGWVDKGTERGMDSRGKDGREAASGGGIAREREGASGEKEPGRGKLQGRYPEEGTGQCTLYSQIIPQRGPRP